MRVAACLCLLLASSVAVAGRPAAGGQGPAKPVYRQTRLKWGERSQLRQFQRDAVALMRTDPNAARILQIMGRHRLRGVWLRNLKNGKQEDSKLLLLRRRLGGPTLVEAHEPSRTQPWHDDGWAPLFSFFVSGLRGLTLDEVKTSLAEAAADLEKDPTSRTLPWAKARLPPQ